MIGVRMRNHQTGEAVAVGIHGKIELLFCILTAGVDEDAAFRRYDKGGVALTDIEKVQLDILTQKNSDTLLLDVCELLRAWCITYTLEAIHEYDDEWNALRSIVQLELI